MRRKKKYQEAEEQMARNVLYICGRLGVSEAMKTDDLDALIRKAFDRHIYFDAVEDAVRRSLERNAPS